MSFATVNREAERHQCQLYRAPYAGYKTGFVVVDGTTVKRFDTLQGVSYWLRNVRGQQS